MSQQTVLYNKHVEYGGKIVEFAGWRMPVNYGSQVDEHHQVRTDAGMFDVSHMTIVDLTVCWLIGLRVLKYQQNRPYL